jgi:hypothetical protein
MARDRILTTPTTAAQLAKEQGRDHHDVACELADACRAGRIGGREFNGKIIYYPKGYDMTTHEQYLAAVERLRRVESGEDFHEVYPDLTATMGGDKLSVYDALHDATPATVEWCRTLGGEMFGEALM